MREHRLASTVDQEATTWPERIRRHAGRAFRRWQARRTASALQQLNDDILKDIGVTRGRDPRNRIESHRGGADAFAPSIIQDPRGSERLAAL
jgi:uncharacterized protein YjiS (DUF1127 family)